MQTFTDHLEQYLGKIQHGWSKSFEGARMPFQIASCKGGTIPNVTAFVTLGLSHYQLPSTTSQKLFRQELLMTVASANDAIGIPSLLQTLGCEALNRTTAYLRGDAIGPREPLFAGSSLEAIYVTLPTLYPDPFFEFIEPNGQSKIVAWLIPITKSEFEYRQTHGWNKFEDLLVEKNPDLLNPYRRSIV